MARNAQANENPKAEASRQGQFSYHGLDRVLHEKARLGILASLAAHADGTCGFDAAWPPAIGSLRDAAAVSFRRESEQNRVHLGQKSWSPIKAAGMLLHLQDAAESRLSVTRAAVMWI